MITEIKGCDLPLEANVMGKRKIIYAEFTLGYGDFVSVVRRDPDDGMWHLRKKDIFNRPIRFNQKEQRLEVMVRHGVWDVYEAYIYQVSGWDNDGNPVTIE